MKDTGYACVFENDGKNGPCNKVAEWMVKDWPMCDFHKGFMYSVDYHNEIGKPKKLTKPPRRPK